MGNEESIQTSPKKNPYHLTGVHLNLKDNRVAKAIQAAAKEYREQGKSLFPKALFPKEGFGIPTVCLTESICSPCSRAVS